MPALELLGSWTLEIVLAVGMALGSALTWCLTRILRPQDSAPKDVEPAPESAPTDVLLAVLSCHVQELGSERSAIWARYSAVLVAITLAPTGMSDLEGRAREAVALLAAALCLFGAVTTGSGYYFFREHGQRVGRVCAELKLRKELCLGFDTTRTGTPRDLIYLMSVVALVASGAVVLLCGFWGTPSSN